MIVKSTVPGSTIPRDVRDLEKPTGNLYESLVVIAKRANQISAQIKDELHNKLSEFATDNDTLEEVFENREQIEISTYYEKLPKPTVIATEEYLEGKVYHRNPTKE
ncbi:MAG TPA: DNA-directed RNA polymerase subunit omega [Bacteroidia bacterium]|nr:DNA-directed RNA polymerase subunit omega [Bacteroidia bacterium]